MRWLPPLAATTAGELGGELLPSAEAGAGARPGQGRAAAALIQGASPVLPEHETEEPGPESDGKAFKARLGARVSAHGCVRFLMSPAPKLRDSAAFRGDRKTPY